MLEGSCLCGSIRYQIDGELGPAMLCHCQKCRKSNGAAYAVNALLEAANFTLLGSSATLKAYESSAGVKRFFCSGCGTPLYSERDTLPGMIRLRVGSLDTDVMIEKQAHIYVASKACWDDITDSIPQYDERPG